MRKIILKKKTRRIPATFAKSLSRKKKRWNKMVKRIESKCKRVDM